MIQFWIHISRCFLLVFTAALSLSCQTRRPSVAQTERSAEEVREGRQIIENHIRELAQNLVAQPVMTPRAGFSGYLAHLQVIRTTTKDSSFAVVADGDGYTPEMTPSELQDFAELKGAHPFGGTYAFSGADVTTGSKDRHDSDTRLILEIPGPKGDGLMAIGFADGRVITIKALSGTLDDKRIQSILSVRGDPAGAQ